MVVIGRLRRQETGEEVIVRQALKTQQAALVAKGLANGAAFAALAAVVAAPGKWK